MVKKNLRCILLNDENALLSVELKKHFHNVMVLMSYGKV